MKARKRSRVTLPRRSSGSTFHDFILAEDIERGKPDEELILAAAEGRWEEEGWRLRKDGSRFWADVVITASHDKDGTLLGFTKVTRDITEGKRAREAFLLEVTNALVSNLDIRQLLSAIASCVRQVKPFDYATLALYDAPTEAAAHAVSSHLRPAMSLTAAGEEPPVSLGNSPAGLGLHRLGSLCCSKASPAKSGLSKCRRNSPINR